MNKIVKKLILSVLLISLSTTNTYPIFGFDYIKGFFVSTTNSLVTNVRQTFTSLFNVFRRRNENKGADQLREGIARFEIDRLKEMNGELNQNVETLDQQVEDYQHQSQSNVEARRNDLQQKSEELQEKDSEIRNRQADVGRLTRVNSAIDRELQRKNDELQGANERLHVADEINEGCERQFEQICERQNEIGQLGNLGCVTNRRLQQKDEELQQRSEELKRIANENLLMMQEDFASQSRENEHARLSAAKIEVNRQIKEGRQVSQREEDKLERQETNGQQANEDLSGSEEYDRFDQPEESSCDNKGKERQREVYIPQPKDHLFGNLVRWVDGVALLDGEDLKCSVIDHSDNDFGDSVGDGENIGSSDSNALQKDELTDGWVRIGDSLNETIELFDNYAFYNVTVSPSLKKNGKIIFACVHGTFSNPASYGANGIRQTTKDLRFFAGALSKTFGRAVELISFKWSGKDDVEHRKEAGKVLGSYLLGELGKNPQTPIWTFAHSHGANVVNFAAKKMEEQKKSIDYAIHLGSPISDLRDCRGAVLPLNIKMLYNLYGIADSVQILGSLLAKQSTQRKAAYNPYHGMGYCNVRCLFKGVERNHFNLKRAIKGFPQLLSIIDTYYHHHADLDANFSGSLWQVAIRDRVKTFIDREGNEGYFNCAENFSGYNEGWFKSCNGCSIHGKFGGHSQPRIIVDRVQAVISELGAAAKGPLGLNN